MDIKISVIVTSAQPRTLADCLTALSVQDIEKSIFEVIIVGRPPDEHHFSHLKKWAEKRKMNIIFLYTLFSGNAAACSLGCSHAKASILAFTDAYCMPHRSWLRIILEKWPQSETLVYSGQIKVPLTGKPVDSALRVARLENALFSLANFACTTEAIAVAGGFDGDFKDTWHESLAFYFRLCSAGIPVVPLPQARVVYPVRGRKWGSALHEQWKVSEDALLLKKYPELYRRNARFTPALHYYLTVLCWLTSAVAVYSNNDQAIQVSLTALACCISFLLLSGLRNTRKSLIHFIEHLVNALYTPFLFLYWKISGAIQHGRMSFRSPAYLHDPK